MNLTSLLADLYRRLNYNASPASAVVTRLTAFLNETQREIFSIPEMMHLRDSVMPITAYANTARTGLPPEVARIIAVTDRTNNFSLMRVPLKQLRLTDPGQTFTGSYPQRYAMVGEQAVWKQPATSGLWAASSASADTTQNVYIEGIVTGGYPFTPAATTLNGATRVAIGGGSARTDYIEVTKFYTDNTTNAPVGFVSLYDASTAGNELARIPIGVNYSRCLAVEWFPIQTADTTEYLDYQRTIFDLVNGTDEPMLPPDLHPMMAIGARMKEYEYLDDTRVTWARAMFEQSKTAMRDFVLNDPDRIASLRNVPLRWNRLGPNYPAQYWP